VLVPALRVGVPEACDDLEVPPGDWCAEVDAVDAVDAADGADDAVPVGVDAAAELEALADSAPDVALVPDAGTPAEVLPIPAAAALESALCDGEPIAKVAMSPATSSNAAAADIGSHLLRGWWCCVVVYVAFTGAPSSDRIPCAT
jgi:hypothetical protein